ncbi:hypothetical protein [Lacrimispora sp.]|jgi:hypothetical protein|nr:hypothetical protein [Lacrimispora sp.]EXG86040.1 hypothetical protein K413DRAFT_2852 [Clostridium sp. ASBs410]MDR7813322.1 hypothetical protein [Lacrimispora sp.]SEU26337.1 hypothetical protein SAMN05443270_4131 [Lacrimispora sphenoides]
MNAVIILLIVVYAIIGGLSTLYLFFSMPAVIIWKFYRKFKYNISLMD